MLRFDDRRWKREENGQNEEDTAEERSTEGASIPYGTTLCQIDYMNYIR